MDLIINIIGMIGVVFVTAAYFFLQFSILKYDDLRYHLLNLFGPLLIMVSLIFNWNLPSFIIEIIWISISLYGIWQIISNKLKENKNDKN